MGSKSPFVRGAAVAASLAFVAGCHFGGSGGSGKTTPLATLTPISQCVVDANNDVVVGGTGANTGCKTVDAASLSSSRQSFGEIDVKAGGVLEFDNNGEQGVPLEPLRMTDICLESGSKFVVGSPDDPESSDQKYVIIFTGDKSSPGAQSSACRGEGPNGDINFQKGIDVLAGATLELYGAKGVPAFKDRSGRGGVSWTTLAKPAGPDVPGEKVASTGDRELVLSTNVEHGKEGWEPGDWIVVATTNFDPFDSEFVQIDNISTNADGNSVVILKQALKHYHFGSPGPSTGTCADPLDASKMQPAFLCDGARRNYGVDERAEVGLISRNIVLTSETPTDPGSRHWGGEIKIHQGFAKVAIQGVRLEKFGKDRLGSYPIHFHLAGDVKAEAPLIDSDSIDHSYNKCVTIHATSNLTVSNLVCARIVGHIFYEELQSASEKNPADDSGIVFDHDLGIGAMSNSFDIYPATDANGNSETKKELVHKYWWTGDYMTNAECSDDKTCIGYDGFDVPDTDNQMQATHGFCWGSVVNGAFAGATPPPCSAKQYYIEPASGFWIQNPDTVLTDDDIAGCQGNGRGFWWVPPSGYTKLDGTAGPGVELTFEPLGLFRDDRASACYSGFFAEGEQIVSGQMAAHEGGENAAPSIISTFDGMTATHNRFRAVWMRGAASWFVIKNGHFADNDRSVTLLTSGGVEGNAPGIWQLLEDSVMVGESRDNVGRWGPCPETDALGPQTGWHYGCVDYSHPAKGAHSGELDGKGYPSPGQNTFGYLLYDGPPLVFHDRFVNYNYDDINGTDREFSGELDDADRAALSGWEKANGIPYEGDAALGWFPANQSAYPTATASRELMWLNTNLRHQIYTEHVKINNTFGDSDKNTAIIDEDGTLTGYAVRTAPNGGAHPVHPISLNNLPFNSTSNSVDECLSRGAQNEKLEGRDTSLISPATVGTLEFANLYPFLPGAPGGTGYPGRAVTHWQAMTFTRMDTLPSQSGGTFHPSMTLLGRAGRGLWEPKVSNGNGYTVAVAPTTASNVPAADNAHKAGIWKWIDVGVADVVDSNIDGKHPFYVRLGINYSNDVKDYPSLPAHPADDFTIKRGYKTYMGGVIWYLPKYPDGSNNPLAKYFTYWNDCQNIDGNRLANVPWSGDNYTPGCPAGENSGLPAIKTLKEVASISGLTNSDGTPNLGVYYYDKNTGYLYLNVAQEEPNAVGPSPVGSCGGTSPDASCPDWKHGESYYVCPKNGCIIYTISQNDPNYHPGASIGRPDPANITPPPPSTSSVYVNQLIVKGTSTTVDRGKPHFDKNGELYYTPTNGPVCPATEPPQP